MINRLFILIDCDINFGINQYYGFGFTYTGLAAPPHKNIHHNMSHLFDVLKKLMILFITIKLIVNIIAKKSVKSPAKNPVES